MKSLQSLKKETMAKVTLTRLGSMINAVTAINGVLTEIETAFDNTLSRDGSAPNTLSATVDANSNRIINLPAPVYDHEPARMTEVQTVLAAATGGSIPAGTFPTTILSTDPLNASNLTSGTVPAARMPALTGDVTTTVGTVATTIAANAVTNAKLATMGDGTIKGRADGSGTGVPVDLTGAQVAAIVDAFTGDSGTGGIQGVVPAPAAGDTANNFFLSAAGIWDRPHGHGVRQTVIAGVVNATTGYPDVLPTTVVGSMNLTTQNITPSTPWVLSAACGHDQYGPKDCHAQVTANFTWSSLPISTSKIYLYYNAVTGARGFTTLAPIYAYWTTPISVTNGQFTFNITEMKGYLGNGTTAPQTPIVFVGECTTTGTDITNIIEYAYNGYYENAYVAVPASPGLTAFNHNIGVSDLSINHIWECFTAELGYSIGDEVNNMYVSTGALYLAPTVWNTRLQAGVASYAAANHVCIRKDTGVAAVITPGNWKYKLILRRAW